MWSTQTAGWDLDLKYVWVMENSFISLDRFFPKKKSDLENLWYVWMEYTYKVA